MVYTIDVWSSNLNAIFGSAYPAIGLYGDDQCVFIRDLIAGNITYAIAMRNPVSVVGWKVGPFKKFQIQITPSPYAVGDEGYGYACEVEKYVNTFHSPRTSFVPAFLTYFSRRGY